MADEEEKFPEPEIDPQIFAMVRKAQRRIDRDRLVDIDKRVALVVRTRAQRKFPRGDLMKQLEFIAHDVLLARRIALGDIEADGSVQRAPNMRLLLQAAKNLSQIVRMADEAKKKDRSPQPPEKSDEIDEAILTADQQAAVDQAIKKNQEAMENARRTTRADGLPKANRGYTWKPSSDPSSPGILVPVRVDGGEGNGANHVQPEGERPPASFEITTRPREGS